MRPAIADPPLLQVERQSSIAHAGLASTWRDGRDYLDYRPAPYNGRDRTMV
jgi:hypothetical protein